MSKHKRYLLKHIIKTVVFSLLAFCLISSANFPKLASPNITVARQVQAQNSDNNDFKLSARTRVGQITLSSDNNNFAANMPLEFDVAKGKSAGLAGVGQTAVGLWQNLVDVFGSTPENKIEIEIINRGNEVVEKLDENYSDTNTSITIPSDNLIPGTYTLEITDVSSGTSYKQDFTWGVLAINTNKPTYLQRETAKITMAVLNDRGMMVCDALVNLDIKNPEGKVSVFSTRNGNIKVNPECEKKDFTLKPDYEADFNTTTSGTYTLTLTAETGNGTYSISDTFEVKANLDYDIERISATRLYPKNNYPVIIKVKANKNFQGVVEETVPSDFMVYYLTDNQLYERFSITENLQKGLVQTLPGHVDGNKKTIRWRVDWTKGETYTLAYYFKPSEKSPDFFTLGTLKLFESNQEVFKEARLWQLANDAIATNLVVAWPSTVALIPSGWQRVTALDSTYTRGVPNASTNPGTTGGAATHSHTTPAHSHTISHTHASATSGNAVGSVTAGTSSNTDLIGVTHSHTTGAISATTDSSGEASPTSGNTSNDPAYLSVIWIEPITTATGIPNNALAMFNTDAPTNWAIYANSVDRYLKGATASGDGGGTSGSNTHSHTGEGSHTHSSSHTHPGGTSGDSGATNNSYATGTVAAGDNHSHSYTVASSDFGNSNTQTLTTSTDNSEPPYHELAVIQNQTGANSLPSGIIAVWRGTIANIPTGWKICDGNNSTPNLLGDFIKGATNTGEIGTTGGGTAHTHTGSNHTHTWASTAHTHAITLTSPPSVLRGTAGATATWASATHSHTATSGAAGTVTVGTAAPNLDSATHTPPYEEVAYIQHQPTDTFTGYVYTDDTEGTALTSASVCLAINGTHNTDDCGTTDGTGNFSFMVAGDTVANDQLTFFVDGGTSFGNTVTVATGGNISTLKIYQNHVIVRHDQGSNISIAQMDAYDNSTGNSTDMLFDATDSTTDTLTVEDGNELYIPSGVTFTPAGNLDNGSGAGIDDIKIAGTYTAATGESILVSGSWANSGTFTTSTSTVTFDAPGATTETINSTGATLASFNNVAFNDAGGGATFQLSSAFDVNGNLTITGGTLNTNAQNITLAGNFDNDDTLTMTSGTLTMDATSGSPKTIDADGTGTEAIYDLTFNDGGNNITFQLSTLLTVTNNLTITGGTFDANGSNTITVGGNWTNDDIFTDSTSRVVLNGSASTTLDSNCTVVSTCTNENFYDLEINKTSATDANDNVTLTNFGIRTTNSLTITDGELIQGAYAVQAEGTSAVTIASLGKWTNVSTGDLTLGGSFSNEGTAVFQSNGSSCGGEGPTGIIISSTDTNQRSWTGSGTFTFNMVEVDYQTGTATIVNYGGSDGGHNGSNWQFTGCPQTISGNVYNFGTSSALSACDADTGTYELRLRTSSATYSASCSNSDGSFSFGNVGVPAAGGGIVIWIDHAEAPETDGALIVRYDGVGNSTLNTFYGDAVTVTSDDTNPVTIVNMDTFDYGNDTDIPYTATDSTPDTLVVNSGYELLIKIKSGITADSTVFDPGGTITTNATGGDLHIDDDSTAYIDTATSAIGRDIVVDNSATLYINSDTTVGGGDITTSGTSATVSTNTGTPTVTVSGTGSIGGGTTPTLTFYNLTTSGTGTTTISNTTTVNNDITVGSGTTLNANGSIATAGNFNNTTTGIVNISSGTPTLTMSGINKTLGGGSGNITLYNVTIDGSVTFSGSGTNTFSNNLSIGTGGAFTINNSLNIGGNYSNSGTFTANSNTITMTATGTGHTLGGTMTGSSSFYDLVFNDGGSSGAWTFGANSATVTNNFTITGGTVTAPSTTLTIGNDFSNSDGFSHNSGMIVFDSVGNVSSLTYSAPTTFNNFTVGTAGKQMQFDNDAQTNIAGLFSIQGSNCTTGRVFLDSDIDNSAWEIYVSGTFNIDYADIEDSTAITTALTADSSTADNDSNTNWTINSGGCVAPTPTPSPTPTPVPIEPYVRGETKIRGGTRILYNWLNDCKTAYTVEKWSLS